MSYSCKFHQVTLFSWPSSTLRNFGTLFSGMHFPYLLSMVAMATATLSPTDVDKFSHLKSVVVALSQIQSLLFLFSNFLHRSFASSQSWIWTSLFLIPFFLCSMQGRKRETWILNSKKVSPLLAKSMLPPPAAPLTM